MAQRKNLKWQVHEAVMDSSLPPAKRLMMFVFADLADAETGVIPEERKDGTTIAELARRTGYDEATIKRHKPELIELGWVHFKRPTWKQQSNHETGTYMIAVGRNPDPKPAKSRKGRPKPDPGAHSAPPAQPDQNPEPDEPGAHDAPPAEAQDAPPPEAHSAPSPGVHHAPPEGSENDRPGAHHAPAGGAPCAPPVAHHAPPIEGTPTPTSTTDFFLVPDADASAPESAPEGTPKKRTRKKPNTDEPRPDVEKLCARFAELLVENECRPPEIGKAWRDAARLMLDKDGRQLDKALALMEWTQHDDWWKSRVMSMPKFREKYDTLRLQAVDQWRKRQNNRGNRGNGPDWNAAMARAEARDDAADVGTGIPDEYDDEPLWKRALPA